MNQIPKVSAVLAFWIWVPVVCLCQQTRQQTCVEIAESISRQEGILKGITAISGCIANKADDPDLYLFRSELYSQIGNYSKALTDLEIVLQLQPNSLTGTLFKRGVLRYKNNNPNGAVADFNTVKNSGPSETTEIIYQHSEQGGNAIFTPQSGQRFQEILYYYLSLCYSQLEQQDRALICIDSALLLNSKAADYWVIRGDIHIKLGKDGASDFRKALELEPDHMEARLRLKLKMPESEEQPSLLPLMTQAFEQLNSGNYTEAINNYTKAIQLNNKLVELWYNRGLAREKSRDLAGAIRDYTKALELDEKYVTAWLNRGNLYFTLQKFDNAYDDFTAAILLDPSYSAAYFNRAMTQLKRKNASAGCLDIKKAESLGFNVPPKLKSMLCQ